MSERSSCQHPDQSEVLLDALRAGLGAGCWFPGRQLAEPLRFGKTCSPPPDDRTMSAGGALGGFDQREAPLGTEYIDRGVEAVGGGTVAGHHRHAATVHDPKARPGVDDVQHAPAVDLDVPFGVARGRDGRVAQGRGSGLARLATDPEARSRSTSRLCRVGGR